MSKIEELWWNLDQAIAWVMTGDSHVVTMLAEGGITVFINYPMEPPYNFQTATKYPVENFWTQHKGKTYEDLLSALRNGKLRAKGKKNGSGDTVAIDPDAWEDLTIKFPPLYEPRGISFAVTKNGNGPLWSDIRFPAQNLKRIFPETPLPLMIKPDQDELKKTIETLIAEYRKEGKTLNRETIYSEVNGRLTKGRIISEMAREILRTIPPDLKKPRNRPPKKKSAK